MKHILLTNDDSYKSIGFYPLYRELIKDFRVTAVAPAAQQSWLGKAITPHRKLRLEKTFIDDLEVYVLDGTPADCIQVGLYSVVNDRPDLIVSGINIGVNVGHGRLLSSGTVGAAMEAAIDGIRAISSALDFDKKIRKTIDFFDTNNYTYFENAAKVTTKIIAILIDKLLEPDIDLISLNLPQSVNEKSNFEITSIHREPYGQLFHKKDNRYIHQDPPLVLDNAPKGSDYYALLKGNISITPISLDLTSIKSMKNLQSTIQREW